MNKLEHFLKKWPHPLIQDFDLTIGLNLNDSQMHSMVHRALKNEVLTRLRRGLYLVAEPYRKKDIHPFTIAQSIYGPSYISFQSALSYHGWIPEAVMMMMSATSKRSKMFENKLGTFRYLHIPSHNLFDGVERIGSGVDAFLIADPWKAIADHFYVFKRPWIELDDLLNDLRIESESIEESDLNLLQLLSERYPSKRVRGLLTNFSKKL